MSDSHSSTPLTVILAKRHHVKVWRTAAAFCERICLSESVSMTVAKRRRCTHRRVLFYFFFNLTQPSATLELLPPPHPPSSPPLLCSKITALTFFQKQKSLLLSAVCLCPWINKETLFTKGNKHDICRRGTAHIWFCRQRINTERFS